MTKIFKFLSENQSFSPRTWFEQLFGFKESVESVQNNFDVIESNEFNQTKLNPPPLQTKLVSKVNGKSYNAGNFQIRSSDRKSYHLSKSPNKNNGKLNIIHGYGRQSKHYELVDILSMQSIPAFNGATYLAASNFNCLEFVSCYQTASSGVTSYYADPTQGPYAALACGPSIVYRNYFLKHDNVIGQISSEINLLSKTPIPVTHGYAIIHDNKVLTPPKPKTFWGIVKRFILKLFMSEEKLNGLYWTDPKIWQVGVHRNCEVALARGSQGEFCFARAGVFAHHVYAAAFNFASDVVETDLTRKVSTQMLTAEYRATILAAWENSILYPGRPGSNKLSLTLLGGGVFNNPYDIICGAIAENVKLIKESGLQVYVTCYDDRTFRDVMQYLQKAVDETKGIIYDTNDEESCAQLLNVPDEVPPQPKPASLLETIKGFICFW
ncbi:hypothetical protein M9Y10_035687 [Tritrichomonas musculus]|uniref:Uncharacterized protein n=1 Tax=Tritrichomonas musculus TaxID=1915356 RepID=A0ABR2GXA9_9EUKA